MMYSGLEPDLRIAVPRKAWTWNDVGRRLKTANPTTSLEVWSTMMAIHQQKGQRWNLAKGNQGTQKPALVGTVVRSTCQM